MSSLFLLRTVSSVGLGEPPGQDHPWYPTFMSSLVTSPLLWKTFIKLTSSFLCQGSAQCLSGCLEFGTTLSVSAALFALFPSRCTSMPPFPSRELIPSSERPSRSRGVYSLCGWAAATTGNESERQWTLCRLQIFDRIITGLCSQMTCPQILHHQAFPPSSSGWLLSSEQLQVSLHKCWTFVWRCCFSMQRWHTKWDVSQICGVFGSICPFNRLKLFGEGEEVSKEKPGAEVKIPSITFKLTSQSFTANWAIWLQFKVLYWLNKPEPLTCLTKLLPETAGEYSHNILFFSKQPSCSSNATTCHYCPYRDPLKAWYARSSSSSPRTEESANCSKTAVDFFFFVTKTLPFLHII